MLGIPHVMEIPIFSADPEEMGQTWAWQKSITVVGGESWDGIDMGFRGQNSSPMGPQILVHV